MKYRTKDGDVLDQIAFNQYGQSAAVVHILEANRELHLSDYPDRLPSGLVIELPDISPAVTETVRLWS